MAHFQQLAHRGNRWQARVRAPDGSERTRLFRRKIDAQKWAATLEADMARGAWVDPTLGKMRFAEFVEIWKAGLHDLRDSTLDLNLSVVRNHLVPRFGATPLSRITHADVKVMIADDVVAGYSGSAVRRHAFVLRGILDAAVLDGRLGRNVADGVKLPPESARPMRFLTPAQLAAVADAIRPAHYRALVLTAGWVGLRWGELAGLALDHVDLLRDTITIDRQLTEVGGRVAYGPPKTSAGVRTVSVPAALTDVLAEHFATDPVQMSGLAFPTVTGRSMRRSNFRKVWRKAADRCFAGTDLSGLTMHELRHTAASLAIAHGAHPVTVKERLGHSSITVTMDRYGHMFPSQDQALAEALDASLRESLAEQPRNSDGVVTQMRRSEA